MKAKQLSSQSFAAIPIYTCQTSSTSIQPKPSQFPQIRQLYGIKSEAAISLTFAFHCNAIAASFYIPYFRPI